MQPHQGTSQLNALQALQALQECLTEQRPAGLPLGDQACEEAKVHGMLTGQSLW